MHGLFEPTNLNMYVYMYILQVCSNGTRVYVHESILEPFLHRLVEKTKSMKIGDPFADGTHVGSMISKDHAERTLKYIDTAKKEVGLIFVISCHD